MPDSGPVAQRKHCSSAGETAEVLTSRVSCVRAPLKYAHWHIGIGFQFKGVFGGRTRVKRYVPSVDPTCMALLHCFRCLSRLKTRVSDHAYFSAFQ